MVNTSTKTFYKHGHPTLLCQNSWHNEYKVMDWADCLLCRPFILSILTMAPSLETSLSIKVEPPSQAMAQLGDQQTLQDRGMTLLTSEWAPKKDCSQLVLVLHNLPGSSQQTKQIWLNCMQAYSHWAKKNTPPFGIEPIVSRLLSVFSCPFLL